MPLENPSTSHRMTYQLDLGIMAYEPVWHLQRNIVAAKIGRSLPDMLMVVEHEPVYTVGRSKPRASKSFDEDFIRSKGAQICYVERGGDVTWHGPGQIVCYPIFYLKDKKLGLGEFVSLLEEVVIVTLKVFDLTGGRRQGMRGVWVGDQKIASVGLAVKKWISYHGIALNVSPDMSFFNWIVPCALKDIKMVSMQGLVKNTISVSQVKPVLINAMAEIFKLSLTPIKLDEAQEIYVASPSFVRSP
jgi:lipoate-protein ligase B